MRCVCLGDVDFLPTQYLLTARWAGRVQVLAAFVGVGMRLAPIVGCSPSLGRQGPVAPPPACLALWSAWKAGSEGRG